MTRAEHLAWAKARALEYVTDGDLIAAFASLASDFGKHPELRTHAALELELGPMLLVTGHLNTAKDMTDWIEGCN